MPPEPPAGASPGAPPGPFALDPLDPGSLTFADRENDVSRGVLGDGQACACAAIAHTRSG